MKTQWLIFVVLLLLIISADANDYLRVVNNNITEQILWEKPRNPSVKPFLFAKDAALGGDLGILYQSQKENNFRLEVRAPFFVENWITFLIYVDHWTFSLNSAETLYVNNFLNISIGEPIKNKQPTVFVQGKLYSYGNTVFLNIRSHFSINSEDIYEVNIPVTIRKIHTVELCMSSGNNDVMGLSLYLDKKQKHVISKKYPFSTDFTEISLNSSKVDRLVRLFLDEFVVSNRRMEAVPVAPVAISEGIENGHVNLACAATGNDDISSIHNATCWVLNKIGDTLLPLYVSEEVDTSLLYRRTIPFELDSGIYEWYCYFINGDGIAGPLSTKRQFNVSLPQTTASLKIINIFPSIIGKNNEVTHLEPGKWYDWHIKTDKPFLHKDISYWLVNLSNPLYKFGHPVNKGGAFICSLNVIYNISMNENGKWLLYEKKDNNSLKSIRVFPGTRGFLLDDTQGAFKISYEKGYVRFRGMIPKEAVEGNWVVSVYAEDVEGKNTNILRKTVSVSKIVLDDSRTIPILIFVSVAIFLLALVFWLLFLRSKGKEKNNGSIDPSFSQVREYVIVNIDKELSLKTIAINRAMSVKAVQDALKRNGFKTLPAFVNKIRIEKAAQLLQSPNLTVSEIGYAVGYDNSEYFSRIFREIKGITPSEYRKKFIS